MRHNVNFSMKKNTMAALVGPSGGEKQRISIARCILRRVSMKQLQKRMPPLFGRGVRILYTPAKVDIHPRTPLEGKIKKY